MHMLLHYFFIKNILSVEGARPKKMYKQKSSFLSISKNLQKVTQPFYPILKPNTSYVKKILHRGPKGSQEIPKFFIKVKVTKFQVSWRFFSNEHKTVDSTHHLIGLREDYLLSYEPELELVKSSSSSISSVFSMMPSTISSISAMFIMAFPTSSWKGSFTASVST